MPATIQKVTYFFEGRARGWTESYWYSSPDGVHANSVGDVQKLANVRVGLLGLECYIKAYRISNEGTGPDALLEYDRFAPKPILDSAGNAVNTNTAQSDVALQIRCENEPRSAHKFVFMRGIWDSVEQNHGQYVTNDKWDAAMRAFRSVLVRDPWGWIGVTFKNKVRLANYVQDADDIVTFTTVDPLFDAGLEKKKTTIRISGVNDGRSAANKTHIVQIVDRSTAKSEKKLALGNRHTGGFVAWQKRDFIKIKFATDQKIVSRECGAPLLESPGRQKAKARA